ncbi:TPA: hypothetical protein UM358_000500 [Stenotrophomonas maltophilia]|nr:hypothetical protein [Stenotrophomonas maltophilia]HEL4204067.1 hypothetical protein [Stenotrophomonas maltophilia]
MDFDLQIQRWQLGLARINVVIHMHAFIQFEGREPIRALSEVPAKIPADN